MKRRGFFPLVGALFLCSPRFITEGHGQPATPQVTLLSAPLELAGDWGGSPPGDAAAVISRVREVSLAGVKLVSDHQPDKLRVDEHSSGLPAIWLHSDPPKTAWIIVDIGDLDWCKLAYQFGHELGHVLCNSWESSAAPRLPSQWLEESLVEAFSIRGLGLLATSWEQHPPFPGDAPFANSIRKYRTDLIEKYKRQPTPDIDIDSWFRTYRSALEHAGGLSEPDAPAVLGILAEMERDETCVEDLGAVNRWPARSGVPIEEYLTLWDASCAEVGACGRLPMRLRRFFHK